MLRPLGRAAVLAPDTAVMVRVFMGHRYVSSFPAWNI